LALGRLSVAQNPEPLSDTMLPSPEISTPSAKRRGWRESSGSADTDGLI